MQRVARFEKVSFEQYKKDWIDLFPEDAEEEEMIREIYDAIKLPKRSTSGSMGYDFFAPMEVGLTECSSIVIPTGIRCVFNTEGWGLLAYPRSGQGFKYGVSLANTTGVIDADYSDSDNEGHIMIKLVNDSVLAQDMVIEEGKGFCQGILTIYGITEDDDVSDIRNGGFGSTDR